MWSLQKVLLFTVVTSNMIIISVHMLEFCQKDEPDCQGQDTSPSSHVINSRWNTSILNLKRNLDHFRVSCEKLKGKNNTDSSCSSSTWPLMSWRPSCRGFSYWPSSREFHSYCEKLHFLWSLSDSAERSNKTGCSFEGDYYSASFLRSLTYIIIIFHEYVCIYQYVVH